MELGQDWAQITRAGSSRYDDDDGHPSGHRTWGRQTRRRERGREGGREAYLPPSCCRAPPPLRHEKIHFVFGNGAPAPQTPPTPPPSPSRFIIAFELTTRREGGRTRGGDTIGSGKK